MNRQGRGPFRRIGATLDGAEMLFHHRSGRGGINITGQHQHSIVWPVIGLEPGFHVLEAGPVKVGHRSDGIVMIGVAFWKQGLADRLPGQPKWLIVALPFLILNDTALIIERLLGDRPEQIAHPVGFEEQRQIERRGGDCLEIIGPVR